MAYVSKVWVDRQTEYPTRRKLAFDDGTGDKIVTVSREEGQIYEAGDIFDANTMNNMESRIAAGIAEKQNILIAGNGIRIDQDNVISATGGGGGVEFTKIESGSLVSVNDAADLPVVDLAVEIKAVQSGTGDPSPSNVRPISGWSSVNVNATGANLWDEQWEVGTLNDTTGLPSTDSAKIRSKNFSPIKGGQTYYVKVPQTIRILFYDASEAFISETSNIRNNTFVVPDNATLFKIRGTNDYGNTYNNDISINYPSTDTEYHAHVNGTTVTIALGQTVYGAQINATRGELTIIHEYGVFSGSDVVTVGTSSFGVRYAKMSILSDAKSNGNIISSHYKNSNDASHDNSIRLAGVVVYIYDNRFVDLETAQAEVSGVQYCYELAQPVTVQLTPTEIETILGINNIWCDSGDILNLEYYTQSASDVRDFIIKDEEVTDDASWSSEKIQDELDAKQDSLTAGDGIVISQNNEISAVLYKELTATLNVFSTSVVFEDSSITTSSVIDIYTSKYGFNPETVTAETGRLTITFRQPDEQITVKVRIS